MAARRNIMRKPAKKKAKTFEQWKKDCSKSAKRLVGIGDLLDDSDPYDVFRAMDEAFKKGQGPNDFIEEIFAEDLARQVYDEVLLEESLADDFEEGMEDI